MMINFIIGIIGGFVGAIICLFIAHSLAQTFAEKERDKYDDLAYCAYCGGKLVSKGDDAICSNCLRVYYMFKGGHHEEDEHTVE